MSSLPDGLLDAARNYLDITWADDAGDEKLSGIVARGIAYLDRVAGVEQDYAAETDARALLFDYCRYVRAGALHSFSADFADELMALHMAGEVTQYDAADV